jgi:hypothetical protein
VAGLIQELTANANFDDQARADIDRAEGVLKPYFSLQRAASAADAQQILRATRGIDRVRAYTLSTYGAELTIRTAERLLGDLIGSRGLTVNVAEALSLEAAMDLLEAPPAANDPAATERSDGAKAAPADRTAREGEGGKAPEPAFVPLTSWQDILAALNEGLDKRHWKNDERTRNQIRKLNEEYRGPIRLPAGRGKQPSVHKAALLKWWTELRERFDARNDEAKAEADSARLTVAESHNYGRAGTVIPAIGGSEKKRKSRNR